MDIGTLIGIILGIGLVVGSIVMGGGAGFLNVPSIMITVGGAFASTLMNFPLPKIIGTIGVVRKAFASQDKDYLAVFNRLSDFAIRARRDGILGLESEVENLDDVFMQKGLRMAVDGNSAEVIEAVLEQDIASMVERHQVGQAIFAALGNYAPAFGMIGTLIGLVQMLRNLDDPSSIGIGMSVALLTTLYGSLVANIFALPIQGKLEQRSTEEVSIRRMVLQGILSIQQGDSPRVAQEKLRSYMPPNLRAKAETA